MNLKMEMAGCVCGTRVLHCASVSHQACLEVTAQVWGVGSVFSWWVPGSNSDHRVCIASVFLPDSFTGHNPPVNGLTYVKYFCTYFLILKASTILSFINWLECMYVHAIICGDNCLELILSYFYLGSGDHSHPGFSGKHLYLLSISLSLHLAFKNFISIISINICHLESMETNSTHLS